MYGRSVRPILIVLGGVITGIVAVLAFSAITAQESEPPPSLGSVDPSFAAVVHDDASADALIAAWGRWRTSSFVSSGTWTRTLDDNDTPLSGDTYTAQDPPRRLVIRLGSVLEQIDGELTTCDAPTEGVIVPGCSEVRGQRTYADRLEAEFVLVVGYVKGETRIYDVAQSNGCFQVELLAAALRSPWGRAAEFCFDEESGALWSSRVRRQTAVDVEQTIAIRLNPTEADF